MKSKEQKIENSHVRIGILVVIGAAALLSAGGHVIWNAALLLIALYFGVKLYQEIKR